jgi:hypothetical protein
MKTISGDRTSLPKEMSEHVNSERMMQMITGYRVTQIVHAVAKYSIADELAKGPATAADIASRQSMDPEATFRLLHECASIGLVTADSELRFAATGLLDTLRRDAPGSLHGLALSQAAPGHWLSLEKSIEAVMTARGRRHLRLEKRSGATAPARRSKRRSLRENHA